MTICGKDPLLSEEENTANLVEPPTEEEKNQAITGSMSRTLSIVCASLSFHASRAKFSQAKAVTRFKNLLARKRPAGLDGILGKDTRIVQPPLSMSRPEKPPLYHKTRSVDTDDRRPLERALVTEGIHRDVDVDSYEATVLEREDTAVTYAPKSPTKRPSDHDAKHLNSPLSPKRTLNAHPQDHRTAKPQMIPQSTVHGGKGQAHDPLDDHLYLALGLGGSSLPPSPPAVSESPPAAEDVNIYETAYHLEIERLRSSQAKPPTLFLTRRVEGREEYQKDEGLVRGDLGGGGGLKQRSGLARVLDQARMKAAKGDPSDHAEQHGGGDDDDDEKTTDTT